MRPVSGVRSVTEVLEQSSVCRAVRPVSSFGSASNSSSDRSSKPVRRSASSAMRARATSIGSSGNVMWPTVSTLLLLDESEVRAGRLVNALLRSCAETVLQRIVWPVPQTVDFAQGGKTSRRRDVSNWRRGRRGN